MSDRPPAETDVAVLRGLRPAGAADAAPGPLVELPVVFDGPDLEEVARLTGRSAQAVVA